MESEPLMSSSGQDGESLEPNGVALHQERPMPYVGCVSCRTILIFMSFLGFINVYCLRVNLSVALVDMVNDTQNAQSSNSSGDSCPTSGNVTTSPHVGEFNWDKSTQGLVLGSFFYGYITTQIIGGWLAEKVGGKLLLGFGILCTAALSLLTAVAAQWSVYALVALRILEGIGEGVTFPSMHALLGQWAPPFERSRMGTFVYAGAQLGTVIGMIVSGFICDSPLRWPFVFYIFGIAGCIWFVFWMFLCFDSPAKHPRITREEREYIETSIGKVSQKKLPTPWKSILTSVPVWACGAAHFANNWGYYTLLTCLPTYMNDVLHFDIKKSSVLSGLPYLACWFSMVVSGQVADIIRRRKYLTTQTTRKVFTVTGLILPGVLLIASGFTGCNYTSTVVLVVAALGTLGIASAGYNVNHLDLAPPFAGTLMGLTNTLATIPGFVGPQIAGALTLHESTRVQWQKVFYISFAVDCFGAIVFLLFGSGQQQKWAEDDSVVRNLLNRDISAEDE